MAERERLFLNVEDDPLDTELLEECLREAGHTFRLLRVETRSDYLEALGQRPDVILCDFNLPLFSGMEALALARERAPDIPFIFISGTMGENVAVETLQNGATDYVLKEDLTRLAAAVRRAMEAADQARARANAERDLVHREKLALIGQLSAGIAHEINNPITFINLNLETLVEYADALQAAMRRCRDLCAARGNGRGERTLRKVGRCLDDLPVARALEDLPKLGRETLEGGRRVSEIVRSLRGFSRGDWAEPVETDLSECAEAALKLAGNEVKHKGEVDKRLADPGPRVRARPGQLVQVILNLLVNAAQAVAGNGHIELEVGSEGGQAVIRVRDDGVGIAAADLDRLFTPFFTTKPPGMGTGLGLYISHGIIKSHGGEIRAASRPGERTEFTVTLPLAT